MVSPFYAALILNKERIRRVEVLVGAVDSVDKIFLRRVIPNQKGFSIEPRK
jgi:hypothetical protein